jgi:hypothetical protein
MSDDLINIAIIENNNGKSERLKFWKDAPI